MSIFSFAVAFGSLSSSPRVNAVEAGNISEHNDADGTRLFDVAVGADVVVTPIGTKVF